MFKAPEEFSPFYRCKKIPRKMKKVYKKKYPKIMFNDLLTLNQKLWEILGNENIEYKKFLINLIIK